MNKKILFLSLMLFFLFLPTNGLARNNTIYGIASWYGSGKRSEGLNYYTSSREPFNPTDHTCASWYHPFGTILQVTNVKNGRSVAVRVNDRGPATWLPSRVIDLSRAAFHKIAPLNVGLVTVKVDPLGYKPSARPDIAKECTAVVYDALTRACQSAFAKTGKIL